MKPNAKMKIQTSNKEIVNIIKNIFLEPFIDFLLDRSLDELNTVSHRLPVNLPFGQL